MRRTAAAITGRTVFVPIKVHPSDVVFSDGSKLFFYYDYKLKEVDGGTEIHLSDFYYNGVLCGECRPRDYLVVIPERDASSSR